MLHSYLKVIFRNFFSDGFYTAIIVIGLAVGIAVSLIIGQYIYFELSFDKEYEDRDRIYYTYMNWQDEQGVYDMLCHPAVSPFIKKSIPEVESSVRLAPGHLNAGDDWVLQKVVDGKRVDFGRIDKTHFADPELFDFFSIPLLMGDPKTALVEPRGIVLSKSIADKFFPSESPMGKTLQVLTFEFNVTGVVDDPAPNSTLQYNVFFSMNFLPTVGFNLEEHWTHPIYPTFIKISPPVNPQIVEEKINQAAEPHLSRLQKEYKIAESFKLYPFQDFHFYKPRNIVGGTPVEFSGDKRIIGFFAALALLILVICWANYINLTIARALRRAKEVGLRKVSGAGRSNLILQFLSEFLFLNLITQIWHLFYTLHFNAFKIFF